jgi:hypothetical protein
MSGSLRMLASSGLPNALAFEALASSIALVPSTDRSYRIIWRSLGAWWSFLRARGCVTWPGCALDSVAGPLEGSDCLEGQGSK